MLKKIAIVVAILFVSLLAVQLTALGDLNSNESELIAIVRGEFEYDGEVYRVKESYIQMAISYLSGDDIDVTDSQKQKAISMMFGNIPEGIERGYLVKVDKSQTNDDLSAADGGGAGTGTNGSSANGSNSTTPPAQSNSNPSDLDAAIYETPKVITSLERAAETTLFPTVAEEPALIQEITGTAFYQNVPSYLFYWNLILLLLFYGMAFYYGMLPGKGEKRKGFRKLRQRMCYLSVLSLAVLTACTVILPLFSYQHFQKDKIMEGFHENGYYTEVYEEAAFDIKLAFLLLDIPASVADEIVSFEKIFISANGYITGIFEGEGDFRLPFGQYEAAAADAIRSYLSDEGIHLTSAAEDGLDYLCRELDKRVTGLMKLPDAEAWYAAGISYRGEINSFVVKSVVLAILFFIIFYLVHHHKKSWLKYLGITVTVASPVAIAASYFLTPFWNWRDSLSEASYIRGMAEQSLVQARYLTLVLEAILFFIGVIILIISTRKKSPDA